MACYKARRFLQIAESSAEIDLAIASGGPNAGPKAKENGRPDHERNHNCVPQRRSSRAAAQKPKTIRTPIAK
jgi:hypothetical protein